MDLTDQLKDYVSSNGIDMPEAEIPPGDHRIRVDVRDVDGVRGSAEIILHSQIEEWRERCLPYEMSFLRRGYQK